MHGHGHLWRRHAGAADGISLWYHLQIMIYPVNTAGMNFSWYPRYPICIPTLNQQTSQDFLADFSPKFCCEMMHLHISRQFHVKIIWAMKYKLKISDGTTFMPRAHYFMNNK
jgi:hypothetical protein